MLFFFLVGHALMDYGLQSDAIAVCKCRKAGHPLQQAVPWYYWLTAHALLHGGAVGAVVRGCGYDVPLAAAYGIAEAAVHWCIDLGKCEKWYGIHVDQGLHVGCKVLWYGLLVGF